MAEVSVRINGRTYPVACENGEEEHLTHLANYLDARVAELAGRVGQIGDAQLVVMASLMVADELSEAYDKIDKTGAGAEGGSSGRGVSESLAAVAERVENIAAKLESA